MLIIIYEEAWTQWSSEGSRSSIYVGVMSLDSCKHIQIYVSSDLDDFFVVFTRRYLNIVERKLLTQYFWSIMFQGKLEKMCTCNKIDVKASWGKIEE